METSGESIELADGLQVNRLSRVRQRRCRSLFGEFELNRVVYGTRAGQAIEYVPLDARLGLPEEKLS